MTAPRDQRRARRNAPFVLLLLVTTIAGTAIRFAGLSNRDFWYDESCTFIYVHNLFDWPESSSLLAESTNLPYYILLRGWSTLLGDSEAAYRSLSALMASLTIVVLAWGAWLLRGRTAAVICAVLVAVHPLHVHYAREARAYALWVVILALATGLLIKATRENRWRWWIAFGMVALFSLHLHYYTLFWLPFTGAIILIAEHRRTALRRWLTTLAGIGLLFIPYFVLAVLPAARAGGSRWIAPSFDAILTPLQTLMAFVPGGRYPDHLAGLSRSHPDTLRFSTELEQLASAATLVAIVLVAATAYTLIRFRATARSRLNSPSSQEDQRRACAALLVMIAGPLLLAWSYSVLVRPIYLPGRYDLVAWPAFMLLLSIALANLRAAASSVAPANSRCETTRASEAEQEHRGRFIPFIATILLALCCIFPLARQLLPVPAESLAHRRADIICALTNPDDVLITLSYDREYLLYYLHRCGFTGTVLSYPIWLDAQIGWLDTEADLARGHTSVNEHGRTVFEQDANALVASLAGRRAWLAADSLDPDGNGPRGPINEYLFAALTAEYTFEIASDEGLIWRLLPESNQRGD